MVVSLVIVAALLLAMSIGCLFKEYTRPVIYEGGVGIWLAGGVICLVGCVLCVLTIFHPEWWNAS